MVSKVLLVIIILVGGFFRFSHVVDPSRGVHPDEILYGYEGMSIAQTGTDHRQTGYPPFYLKGYSQLWDNRTSILYPYVLGGLFKLFTPSLLLVRLLSVVAGTLTILLTYLLGRELSGRRQVGLVAAGLVAISPSAIYWSRIGHDPITVPLFLLGLSWAVWRAARQPGFWIVAAAITALSLYSYQSLKLIGPLLFLLGLWFQRRHLKASARYVWAGLGVAAIIAGPSLIAHLLHWRAIQGELAAISLWRDPHPWAALGANIRTVFGQEYFFSNSLMFVFLLPFFIAGTWLIGRKHPLIRSWLLAYTAIALLPALITNLDQSGTLAASRAIGHMGIMEIGVAFSLGWLIDRWSKYWPRWGASIIVSCLVVPAIIFTWVQFFSWPPYCCLLLNNYQQPLALVEQPPWNERPVVIDYHQHLMPMATLWFIRYSPAQFQAEPHDWQTAEDDRGPGDYPGRFGRFSFCRELDCYRPHDGALYILPDHLLPDAPVIGRYSILINGRFVPWKIVDNI